MVETEALNLPTKVFRDQVQEQTGRIYSFLFSHITEVIIVIFLLLMIFIIVKLKNYLISRRARKVRPESTNEWFDWEDFEKWKKSQGK